MYPTHSLLQSFHFSARRDTPSYPLLPEVGHPGVSRLFCRGHLPSHFPKVSGPGGTLDSLQNWLLMAPWSSSPAHDAWEDAYISLRVLLSDPVFIYTVKNVLTGHPPPPLHLPLLPSFIHLPLSLAQSISYAQPPPPPISCSVDDLCVHTKLPVSLMFPYSAAFCPPFGAMLVLFAFICRIYISIFYVAVSFLFLLHNIS
jgi:hypothetical protein